MVKVKKNKPFEDILDEEKIKLFFLINKYFTQKINNKKSNLNSLNFQNLPRFLIKYNDKITLSINYLLHEKILNFSSFIFKPFFNSR